MKPYAGNRHKTGYYATRKNRRHKSLKHGARQKLKKYWDLI